MRLRVLAVLVVFSLLAVTGFVLPLLDSSSRVRTQQLLLDRVASLDRFSALATQASASGDPVTLRTEVTRFTSLYGEGVLVVGSDGKTLVATGGVDQRSARVAPLLAQAERNLPHVGLSPLSPWSPRHQLLARPVGVSNQVLGAVVLDADVSKAVTDIRQQWGLVLGGALLVELVLLALAGFLTRWVVRPVRQLDEAAVALAATGDVQQLRGGGPPELRRLAASFSSMAETVTAMVHSQQRMVADCSHQLRNPLAALRLRIDGLGESGAEDLPLIVADLDRLEDLVTDLLDLADAESRASTQAAGHAVGPSLRHVATLVELGLLVGDEVERAQVPAGRAGISVASLVGPEVKVTCNPEDLERMVSELLENAVKYAGHGAHVCVSSTATSRGRVLLAVTDDGPGLPASEVSLAPQRFWRGAGTDPAQGTGLGLAIVATLAEANGAILSLARAHPSGLAVTLDLPS